MKSKTFKIVLASWVILNYMWLSGRVDATLTEYGAAVAVILTVWVGREWKEKHYGEV